MSPADERPTERSYEPIRQEDLEALSAIASQDRATFFASRPEYRDRLVGVALCQGAARHFVDSCQAAQPLNGIKDFDVWTFFAAIPGERFPTDRRNTHVDFGSSRFGRYSAEPNRFQHFRGRRVDLLMRALPVAPDADPAGALVAYLTEARTTSAQRLSEKAVVLIDPADRCGEIVWPPTAIHLDI